MNYKPLREYNVPCSSWVIYEFAKVGFWEQVQITTLEDMIHQLGILLRSV